MRSNSGWIRLATESMVIVASILIAFGVDALWDIRGDRQAERVLLAALEQDMVRNRREAARVRSALNAYSNSAQVFLEADPQTLQQLDTDSAQAFIVFTRVATFDAADGALRNRDLSVLRDDQLLDALGEWSQSVTNLREAGQVLLERSGVAWMRGAQLAPDFFLSRGSESPSALSRLRSDPEFVGALISIQGSRRLQATLAAGLEVRADSIIKLIREQRR